MDPLLIVHRRLLQPRSRYRYEPPFEPRRTPLAAHARTAAGGVGAVVAALMFAPFFGG